MSDLAYPLLVYVHMLLFVMWLGADVGVFVLGQHFRRRHLYGMPERLALLKLLVTVDMVPRTSWALMVPVSLSVVRLGGWWADEPLWLLAAAWIVAGAWLWLVWDAHLHDQTPRAARDRRIESWVRYGLTAFYLGLGGLSLATGAPLGPRWLAAKAMLFGLIFTASIMIDTRFKPVGPQLMRLLSEGSSDATEVPLRATMDRTRRWVWAVYLLLVATSLLGVLGGKGVIG